MNTRIMRKIPAVVLLTALLLAGAYRADAAPVGFPIVPLRTGQYSATLEGRWGERDLIDKNTNFQERTEVAAVEGKFGYGFTDRIGGYIHLGGSELTVDRLSFDGDWGLSVGLGLKGVLLTTPGGWRFCADGQYRFFESEDTGNHRADWDEFQVAATVSQDIEFITPYIGAVWSYNTIEQELSFKPDDQFGLVAGLDYRLMPNLTLALEGRLVHETSVSLGLTYTFDHWPWWPSPDEF
ncbi:MAG: hypothetical protein AB1772_13480 [Candidatus Zixiibacteriota bacterium]